MYEEYEDRHDAELVEAHMIEDGREEGTNGVEI